MKLVDLKVKEFLAEISAKKATPGGGSASALAGAMAAGLVVMVAEFTIGKEKYLNRNEEIKKIRNEGEKLQKTLLELVDKDTQAYQEVVKTKGSQAAVKQATEVPLQTAQKSLEVLKMADFVAKYGNQNLCSDAFCALELAAAAIYGALENVQINLPSFKDEKTVEEFKEKIGQVVEKTKAIVKS